MPVYRRWFVTPNPGEEETIANNFYALLIRELPYYECFQEVEMGYIDPQDISGNPAGVTEEILGITFVTFLSYEDIARTIPSPFPDDPVYSYTIYEGHPIGVVEPDYPLISPAA